MSNYEDDQSEDGELARSPVNPDVEQMDFSLSEEGPDTTDSLDIKPPQAVVRQSDQRRRRGHKRSGKDRHKDHSRREKKVIYRDRDKLDKPKRSIEVKHSEREINHGKEYYVDKLYYRDKEAYREKEHVRDKPIYREKDVYRDKEHYREKEVYRENDPYRDKDVYREKEVSYREKESTYRQKDSYREKDSYKSKEIHRERDLYISREREMRHSDPERKHRQESDRHIEVRSRNLTDEGRHLRNSEKENKDRSSGDKELEDLRSRLLSKRKTKEQHDSKSDRQESSDNDKDSRYRNNIELDKHQQERRNRFIEAEREMARRKQSSRTELEARRERRRGEKRSVSPTVSVTKRTKNAEVLPNDDVVMVSDQSDIEIKSESHHSEQEEGEHSGTETDSESDSTDSDSDSESKEEEDNKEESENLSDKNSPPGKQDNKEISPKAYSRSPSAPKTHHSHSSHRSDDSIRNRSRTRSRTRSRSHSFSPPPQVKNGSTGEEEKPPEPEPSPSSEIEAKMSQMPPYFPALQGCRSVEEFQCLNRIEEGTYGVVYRARDKTTEEIVALKRLKMEKEKEGFPITSLREINTLLKGQHPNIVTVREIVVGSNMDKIFIVMDYVEHDLKSLMETMRGKKQVFLPGEVKCLMTQLLKAVHHLHDNWILHRDLKTSNLLLSHKGILKVGDFGLAREYGSPLRQYTPIVVTLWYRAPELLLCCKEYSTPIDMWSVGCIFAEFLTMNPLFPGKSEVDQLNRIFKDLGTPSEQIWPGYNLLPAVQKMTFADLPSGGLRQRTGPDLLSEIGLSLLQSFLTYNPARRITADSALEHGYFKELPVAIEPAMFPTWPAKSEGGRRTAAAHSPKPPSGGGQYKLLTEDAAPPGFHMGGLLTQTRTANVGGGFSLKF